MKSHYHTFNSMKKRKYFIENYLWFLPFCSFFSGYFLLYYYLQAPTLLVPSLIGKNIHEAILLLSQLKLNARILDQKEEPALPEGTILRQLPTAGQKVKVSQPVFLVTTKKQPAVETPIMINKSIDTIKKELTNSDIRFKAHYLPHSYPKNHCFSQFPAFGQPLDSNHLLIYLAAEKNKPIIMPDFTQHSLEDVTEFLASCNIQPYIIRNTHRENHQTNKIIKQQPLAGSLILLREDKPLVVQLQVE